MLKLTLLRFSSGQKPNDRVHKVRMAIGNGIRPEVWREFVSRFGDVWIQEFYGATEGNFAMMNYINKVGAVGRDTFFHRVTDTAPPSRPRSSTL